MPEPAGHETRAILRTAAIVGIALFLALVGYFFLYGPLHQEEPSNPAAGGNPEVIDRAAPPKQPQTP